MIKHDNTLKRTLAILISGDNLMPENYGNCGADSVLQKPFEPAQLLSMISQQLKSA